MTPILEHHLVGGHQPLVGGDLVDGLEETEVRVGLDDTPAGEDAGLGLGDGVEEALGLLPEGARVVGERRDVRADEAVEEARPRR